MWIKDCFPMVCPICTDVRHKFQTPPPPPNLSNAFATARNGCFQRKMYVFFACYKNNKFVVGSQPRAVGGGGAEAPDAAAERETHAERQAQASQEGGR